MSILRAILEEKRCEVAERRRAIPLALLVQQADEAGPVRGFAARLEQEAQPIALIAEIKKASPSKGLLVEDFDPARIAEEYAQGGASCLSVLTDESFFQGKLEDLREARSATALPALRKDFIVDEYQLYESRAAGADCVLLIVSALERQQLRDYLSLVGELGLEALVEVHAEAEMATAAEVGAQLIGINNRDLATFQGDLTTTARLAPLAPKGTLLVSESAIQTRQDLLLVAEAGARAALVGESLIRRPDIAAAVRELLGR